MTAERKMKWTVKKAKFKIWWNNVGKPLFIGATVGAAWYGYVQGIRNDIANEKLRRELNNTNNVVDNNANCSRFDRQRICELERQQNLLFERALKETEGKAD